MANTKTASKKVIAQMTPNDRSVVIGFTYSKSIKHSLSSDKELLNQAVDKLYVSGETRIYLGI